MSSLIAGINASVLGLTAMGDRMNTHSQNIAAAPVIGAKKRDVFLSTLHMSSVAGSFTPGGVMDTSLLNLDQPGSVSPSTESTYMGIIGQGLFVTTPSRNNSNFAFTRVGTFRPDLNGDFVNHCGQYLKMFPTDSSGNLLTTDTSTLANIVTASIGGLRGAAQPTTTLELNLNLPGENGVGTVVNTPVTIYDSLGGSQTLTMIWTKTGQTQYIPANPPTLAIPASQTWNLTVATPNGTVQPPYTGPGVPIIFNDTGYITSVNGNALQPGTAAGAPNIPIQWNNTPSAPTNIALNLGEIGGNNITAQGSNYVLTANPLQDGRSMGQYLSSSVDAQGNLSATYSNGCTSIFGRIPLAMFPNANALQEKSCGVYTQTQKAGVCVLEFPITGGLGAIAPASTEESTIDSAGVFTEMIIDQKYYTANLKTISTIEKMLDALERAIG